MLAGCASFFALAAPAMARSGDDIFAPQSPPASAPAEPAASPSHWYGGYVLAADSAALLVMVAGIGTRSPEVTLAGMGSWVLAAPVVHIGHGDPTQGILSLVLRLGLPLAGAVVAEQASEGCWNEPGASEECDVGWMYLGLLAGMAVVEVVDVALLARDDWPSLPNPPSDTSVHLVLAPRDHGGIAGLSGRF